LYQGDGITPNGHNLKAYGFTKIAASNGMIFPCTKYKNPSQQIKIHATSDYRQFFKTKNGTWKYKFLVIGK
jgi:hypothetical protein